MDLFYRKYGQGPALIIVHGLYGASDNWVSIAKGLQDYFEVFLIDQRNHGRSPHHPDHTYEAMKEDLKQFMDEHEIEKAVLLGHSMGGKTVMHFAKEYPERISHLIVVDIAPISYLDDARKKHRTLDHATLIQAMRSVDFSKIESRQDVDDALSDTIPPERVRQFLMKNLRRESNNQFSWSLNLEALWNNLPHILDGLNEKEFEKGRGITGFQVLFVKGAESDYITQDVFDSIVLTIFPYAELVTIPKAGHWVHAEQPDLLIKNLLYFVLA